VNWEGSGRKRWWSHRGKARRTISEHEECHLMGCRGKNAEWRRPTGLKTRQIKVFFLLHIVHTDPGAQPALYPMGTGGNFAGNEAAGAEACSTEVNKAGAIPPLPPHVFMAQPLIWQDCPVWACKSSSAREPLAPRTNYSRGGTPSVKLNWADVTRLHTAGVLMSIGYHSKIFTSLRGVHSPRDLCLKMFAI
jgi:hypothetical protein